MSTFSETNIVRPIKLSQPQPIGGTSIIQWGDGYGFQIAIKASTNAKMYATLLRFNYIEQSRDDYLTDVSQGNPLPTTGGEYKFVEWTLPDIIASENQINASENPSSVLNLDFCLLPKFIVRQLKIIVSLFCFLSFLQ